MTLRAGTRLASYEIVGPLGAGGMGEVYRARDAKLSRDVAIKVLPPEPSSNAHRLQRFEKEARAVSALNHPNIVAVYDIGVAEGTSYIVMELVEGKTLREILNAGPVPPRRVLSLGAQMADGLARAHAAGIVHRDLKPDNVMITRDGLVKIVDFGLARLVGTGFEAAGGEDHATLSRGTEAGTILGTVGYMSPEQAAGEPADFRSDQFSLGSILYEMASGRRPFERSSDAQTLSAIIEFEPESLATAAPRVPANLSWVVERCLAKDPEDRYGSTKDLARDLAMPLDSSSGASDAGIAPPAERRLRFSRVMVAASLLAAAVLAALGYLAGARAQARRAREAAPAAQTTLTFRSGYLTGARFAPDGQTIVYSASWDGRPTEIFTTRVGAVDSRPLGIIDATLLSVSSRGEMALLLGCDGSGFTCLGTVARAPLAGGAPREVADAATSADWSPDGNELAVIRAASLEYPIGRTLFQADPIGFLSHVRVSPDGGRVAFLHHPRRDSDRALVTVVDRAGARKVLTREWARLAPILWSPTGEEVFFSSWEGQATRGVSLSGRTRHATRIPGLDDVSRDGLFLDAGRFAENYRGVIRALVPGSSEERNVSWRKGSVVADLSSDGKQVLLFEENRHPGRPDEELFTTFLRATDGSDAKLLGEGRALALSPDTKWALVARAHPETHLVLLPTGAGESRRLEGGGLLYRRAQFFPDGRRILIDGDRELGTVQGYVQEIDGGPPKPVGGDMLPMIVSPDGLSLIAWGGEFLYRIRADGGAPPEKIPVEPPNYPVQWSSDGRSIFVYDDDGGLIVYRVDLATGRRERLRELAPPDRTGFLGFGSRPVGMGLSITPDGRYYAYSYFTDQNRLTLTRLDRDWWK